MPLKLIVFRPTSRMNIAFWVEEDWVCETRLWRSIREAGELTVIVAAVWAGVSVWWSGVRAEEDR